MFLIRYLFSSSFLKNIFFIAVFLIFLLFALLIFLNVFTRNNQSIEVPNLVGKTIVQFDKKLSEMDLKYIIVDTANFNPIISNLFLIKSRTLEQELSEEERCT